MKMQPAVIGGQQVTGGEGLAVLDPATGEVFSRTLRGLAGHVDAAARRAAPGWSSRSAEDRGTLLLRLADLLRRDREQLANLKSRDTGKPLRQARADADVAARYFEFYRRCIESFQWRSHALGAAR